jgi:hypothetical protein
MRLALAHPVAHRPTRAILNVRRSSLARANVLVLGGLAAAILLSHAPELRPTLSLLLPALVCIVGTAETVRCMRSRWSFYHGGVLLCVYMDLLVVTLVLFFLIYPFAYH